MDDIEDIRKWLSQIPIIGKVIGIIIVFYGLNEKFKILTFEKFDPLKKVLEYANKIKDKRLAHKRENYINALCTDHYLEWQTTLLEKIYDNNCLPVILNWKYPIAIFECKQNCVYPFNNILDYENLNLSRIEFLLDNKNQKEYKKMLGSTIKRGEIIGYMLDRLNLDDEENIISISARIGTYEQNIYTSHILEFELYKLYFKQNVDITKLNKLEILNLLPCRKKIHNDNSQLEIISTGANRNSLLGVQMFVMYKNHLTDQYDVLIFQRSNKVAAKANFFQFIPSGGFEVFHKHSDINTINKNFSLTLALFRELLEEAFGMDEYIENKENGDEYNILKEAVIHELIALIKEKKAFFEFLGSVNDLVCLRHLLSFVIRIDDVTFSKNQQYILPVLVAASRNSIDFSSRLI